MYSTSQVMTRVSGSMDSLLTSAGLLSGTVIGEKFNVVSVGVALRRENCGYKTVTLTFGRCVVDFGWLAGTALSNIIYGNDAETV